MRGKRSISAATLWGLALICGTSTVVMSCVPEGDLKLPLNFQPKDVDDGWLVGSPEEVGLRTGSVRDAYEQVFREDRFPVAVAFLVVRDGILVAEGYLRDPDDISRREHIQSVTKSLTSMAFGLARERGYFPDLDASLADFITVSDLEKRDITLRHLLTMRSGIDVDNESFATELLIPERRNMTEWLLSRPMKARPGEEFDYRDCDPQLLGSAIIATTGQSAESLVRERIFEPLEISDIAWEHNADGEPLTAHGVWMRPRDMAKVGEVIRTGGSWQGQRLFDGEWLELATVTQTDAGLETETDGVTYGYYFWIDESAAAYTTKGHGGNHMYVVPDERLLLVLSALPYSSGDLWASMQELAELARFLLEGSN